MEDFRPLIVKIIYTGTLLVQPIFDNIALSLFTWKKQKQKCNEILFLKSCQLKR